MHPILFTLPGAALKLIVPALYLWALWSLAFRAYQHRNPNTKEKPHDPPGVAFAQLVLASALFLYAAPVTLSPDKARLLAAVSALFSALPSIAVWSAVWQGIPLYSYGVMLGISFVVGWNISVPLAQRGGLTREQAIECFLLCVFFAVLGSRVLYVVTNMHEFTDASGSFVWASALAMRNGGLVVYGGFLAGFLAGLLYLRRISHAFWPIADAAAPSLAMGLGITRIGCFLYGCDFGRPLSLGAPGVLKSLGTFPRWADQTGSPAWHQHFEQGFSVSREQCIERFHGDFHGGLCHLSSSASHSIPVHPTQIYESLLGFSLAFVLYTLHKKKRFDGQLFLAFGALYGLARAGLEVLRDDHERGFWLGMSTSQWIGLSTGILCVALYVRAIRAADTAQRAQNTGSPAL